MNAKEAVDWVDPIKWRDTSAEPKLSFLKQIREKRWILRHLRELWGGCTPIRS